MASKRPGKKKDIPVSPIDEKRKALLEYERKIAMESEELERMRTARARRNQERAAQGQVLAIAQRWDEISTDLTDLERRELLVSLLSNITVDRFDEVVVTGALSSLLGSNKCEDGGRYWIRTSDLVDVNDAL